MEKIKINIEKYIHIIKLQKIERKGKVLIYIVILNNYTNVVLDDFFR